MRCEMGPHGSRVLLGRHGDPCGSPETCRGCLPCPESHCLLCEREHAPVVCPTCVAAARINLAAVVRLSGRLDDEALNGQRSARSRDRIPGGDALVLQAPAATERGKVAQLLHRALFGLDVSHTQDESRADPTPPLPVLLHWEDRWRSMLKQPTGLGPTMGRSFAYLDEHMHEAARDLSFVPFAKGMARLVRQLEDVLTDGERPERSRVPCWDCGTRLVKAYGATEAEDHWLCPRCGERYDKGRYDRAKHDHLASAGAERYVYIADAAAAVGRPEQTVRTWVRKGMVRTSRDPKTARLVAWWPDIRQAHMDAATRKRKRSE
jgi:hypothetical protein